MSWDKSWGRVAAGQNWTFLNSVRIGQILTKYCPNVSDSARVAPKFRTKLVKFTSGSSTANLDLDRFGTVAVLSQIHSFNCFTDLTFLLGVFRLSDGDHSVRSLFRSKIACWSAGRSSRSGESYADEARGACSFQIRSKLNPHGPRNGDRCPDG